MSRVGLRVDGRIAWPRVLLVALGVAVVLALVVVGATSSTAFNPHAHDWEGSSEFRGDLADRDLSYVQSSGDLASTDPSNSVLFVVAPTTTDEESLESLERFVAEGGTLVVLDSGQSGNEILAAVGAEARITGETIRDEDHYTEGPNMPVATATSSEPPVHTTEELALNYGSAVMPGNATVLVETSEVAYLVDDPDGDHEDIDTDPGAVPVATLESVGEGEVVTVSDPSIAINVMYTERDNRAFLLALADRGNAVMFDMRFGQSLPPLVAAVVAIRTIPLLQVGLGGLGLVIIAGLTSTRLRRIVANRRAGRETTVTFAEEELVTAVQEAHPNWDESRIRRVMKALNHARTEERGE